MANSSTMPAWVVAASLTLGGCMGSQFYSEGMSDRGSRVVAADVAGVGLIAWSVSLMQGLADEEPGMGRTFAMMGATLPAGLGVAAIVSAETSYGRYKRHQSASARIENLRGTAGRGASNILPPERLRTMSANAIERYEGVTLIQLRDPGYAETLKKRRIAGWCLLIGAAAIHQNATPEVDVDGNVEPPNMTIEALALGCAITGGLLLWNTEHTIRSESGRARTEVIIAPNGIGVAYRF